MTSTRTAAKTRTPLGEPGRTPRAVPPLLVVLAVLGVLVGSTLVAPPATAAAAVDSWGSTRPVGEWPLRPVPDVAHGFDPPSDPWGRGHRGVDLRGAPGQVVRTALAGTVSYAGRLAGRGVVTVGHGATRTTYEPVSATVSVGDRVPRGAVIGRLELAGSHCFPAACLHWGWLRGEEYLDPLDLVGGGPVRLLPLWRDRPVTAGVVGAQPRMPWWWAG